MPAAARTKMINGKRYYYLGTYSKKPSIAAIQRTGASVDERRLHKSFPYKEANTGLTLYRVYYRDVKIPSKVKIAKKARKAGLAPNLFLASYGSKYKPPLSGFFG